MFAQDEYDNIYHQYSADDICYLLADRVNLRDQASTKGKVIANLPIGTEITIIKKTALTLRLKGFESNWYKIKANEKQGYIWCRELQGHRKKLGR